MTQFVPELPGLEVCKCLEDALFLIYHNVHVLKEQKYLLKPDTSVSEILC